jgi:molybdate transport system substrate-binding protein
MRFALSLVCLLVAFPLHAEEIRVAAASDLNFAMKEIIQEFEHSTAHRLRLTLGSSGNFYAQIVNGAPFDVFLSADLDYPRRLEQGGQAVAGSTFVYGVGRIALWVPGRSALSLGKLGMRALVEPSVKKIAIANPEHAPYGRAAIAAMEYASVLVEAKKKLVFGENISQAAQFVQSGAADIGVIALSIALSDPMRNAGRYWVIPPDTYPRMEQGAVLLKRAGPAARAFHEWLRGPETRGILDKYGFGR